jgi:RNA polymerase sigma factor for flagellar operon FliA
LWFPHKPIEKRSFGFTHKKQPPGMTGMSRSAVVPREKNGRKGETTVTNEIKSRQTAMEKTGGIGSWHRVVTRRASVRRQAGGWKREFNRDVNRQKMLIEMLPLVRRVALKIREHLPAHVEVDELTANGVLGLVDAVAKFDASKRVKLESYARHRIRGAILDGLRAADPVTRGTRQKNKRIQKLYRELEVNLGRPVQDEEMAAASRMNLAQWHRALTDIQSVGIDCGSRVFSAAPTTTLQSTDPELLIDGRANPFDLCCLREQREILGRALSSLPERERRILCLYSEAELTMKQIALLMHVDESRVSQLHSAALIRLKARVDSLLHPTKPEISESGIRSMAAGAAA